MQSRCSTGVPGSVITNRIMASLVGDLFGLQCRPDAIWAGIPARARATIVERGLRLLALDTARIARETTSQPDLVQRMQGIVLLGLFLRVAPFVERRGLSEADLFGGVERSVRTFFGKRGEAVVQENLRAIRRGYTEVVEVEVGSHV